MLAYNREDASWISGEEYLKGSIYCYRPQQLALDIFEWAQIAQDIPFEMIHLCFEENQRITLIEILTAFVKEWRVDRHVAHTVRKHPIFVEALKVLGCVLVCARVCVIACACVCSFWSARKTATRRRMRSLNTVFRCSPLMNLHSRWNSQL